MKGRGRRPDPAPIKGGIGIQSLVDDFFLSDNAGRLRDACRVFADKMLEPDVTVGLTMSGALTATGLGYAAFVPWVEAGFVDWIVATDANLYHDIHRSLGFELYGISPNVDDVALRRDGIRSGHPGQHDPSDSLRPAPAPAPAPGRAGAAETADAVRNVLSPFLGVFSILGGRARS
jgi:hypothetical protein